MKKKVQVLDATYQIKTVESFEDASQNGEIDFEAKVISLKKKLNSNAKLTVVVHELIHAALHEMGHKQYRNEKLVGPLATGVAEALHKLGMRV